MIALLVLLAAGCAPAAGDCPTEFAISGTTTDGVYESADLCYEDEDGERDLTACCPEGWYALGLAPSGGVVCER